MPIKGESNLRVASPTDPSESPCEDCQHQNALRALHSDRMQATFTEMEAQIRTLGDEVDRLKRGAQTDPPVTAAAYDGYKGNLTPLSDIAASAVDLGPANLSETFRQRRVPTDPDLRAALASLVDRWKRTAIQRSAEVCTSGIPTDSEVEYTKKGGANGLYEAAVDLETVLRARAALKETPK